MISEGKRGYGGPGRKSRRLSHAHIPGIEHVKCSPSRHTFRAPIAKRRDVYGDSHGG